MKPNAPKFPDRPIRLPEVDDIRAAIDAADERARRLRHLLHLALRLNLHLTTADRLTPIVSNPHVSPGITGKGVARG